ncbi:MAG: hypothetical protein B6245_22155 [Desulfobacteraceae bacterium 4572_88]|nr:MAG: hypothetical protein B6245_22155 [Desulfobacteraceae bacterium 4572_88]
MHAIHYNIVRSCFIAGLIFFLHNPVCSAQKQAETASKSTAVLTISVEEDQNIRDISAKYLQNPDLWEDILRANGLKKPDEIRAGMPLSIPVEAITLAYNALEDAKKRIQQATEAGAKVLAKTEIEKAITIRDNAIEKRTSGHWAECTALANTAAKEAQKALNVSIENQEVSTEAMVDYCRGQVHRRKPSDNMWQDISRYDALAEGEKIRTLSQSYADIRFRDNSLLQLKENAQVLIRNMRTRVLDDAEDTEINLIQGDVFALLSGGKESQFELDIPGVRANIKSKQFRVARDDDEKEVRFANYDKGEVEIESKGKKVILKENQGSVVPHDQKPSDPKELLPSPVLIGPEDGAERFDADTLLSWEGVKGAETYLLELSLTASFSKAIWSASVPNPPDGDSATVSKKFPTGLGSEAFYWRVSAVSPDKLPGRPSKARGIRIIDDKEPPFLVIRHPEEGAIVSEGTMAVSGNTEANATLTIQSHAVDISSEGVYQFSCELSPGENRIVVKATDMAGNTTELERVVNFLRKEEIDLTFDDSVHKIGAKHFIVGHERFTISGKTQSGDVVAIRSANGDFPATATADDQGRFQINLRMEGQKDEFAIEITSPAGMVRKDRFRVEVDTDPPLIRFDKDIPPATAQKELMLAGETEGAVSLRLNGQDVKLERQEADMVSSFEFPLRLNPGENQLQFSAHDQVGNATVIEKTLLSDSEAPRLIDYKLSSQSAKGGERIIVEVQAQDATKLVKTAPFTLQIGDRIHTGYMILRGGHSPSEGKNMTWKYTGVFNVPKNVSGKVWLKTVKLSDYLGNVSEYHP